MHAPPNGPRLVDGPKIRLFVCDECQTIETLPVLEKRDAPDPHGEDHVARHMQTHGRQNMKRAESDPTRWEMVTYVVPQKVWEEESSRKEVIDKIRSAHKHTGIGDDYYAWRDVYREEALQCFVKHNRPQVVPGCPDYLDHSKRIGNQLISTEDAKNADREAQQLLGVARGSGLTKRLKKEGGAYLCYSCPFHSAVVGEKRQRAL